MKAIAAVFTRHRGGVGVAAVLALAALGFGLLHHLLHEVHMHSIRAALHALQPWQIGVSVAATALSYLCLTLYDVLALRVIGQDVPYRTAALASFTSYTLSHNLGLALLTGGSARYRIYSSAGLETGDIMRVIVIAGIGFWSAIVVMTGAALIAVPPGSLAASLPLPASLAKALGGIILLLAAALLVAAGKGRRVRLWRWTLPLPSRKHAVLQIGVAALDLAAASTALFVLVPGATPALIPGFFLAYALAIIVALLSHVPGGIGIFEAVIIATLPQVDRGALAAALIAYRAIYYLLPLVIAALLMAFHERRQLRRPVALTLDITRAAASSMAPALLAALALLGGTVLLVSGSLPAIPDRLHLLRDFVPLPFVEASHVAASLAGTMLLLLAPGLYRRLDGAFIMTRALLIAGAIFSLAKGIDYEEAAVLLVIAAVLQASRGAFYRRTAFTVRSFSIGWLGAVGTALILSMWLGFFAYRHIDYQHDLWWQFAWKGNASRFLRASFATGVLLIAAIVLRFFRPPPVVETAEPCPPPLPNHSALAACDRTDAMLALAGDKQFIASAAGDTLLMYQRQGQTWVVMGDPIGPAGEWPELLWRIRERADAAQGRLLLYQITAQALPVAIDLGLQLVKYGEEARVELDRFTLEGPAAKSLRHAVRRAERAGLDFSVVPAAQAALMLAEIRRVSDQWLGAKGHSEKAFSVGRFDPAYLAYFDFAVVKQAGRVVAFANLWATPNRNELSVDLMRHIDEPPYGTMDFLFVQLMEWGKRAGYRWFSLGIAPLAGLEARRLSPLWAQAGALLYRHGDSLYSFEGLRAWKDKFDPVWEPRYIAGPGGVGMARAMLDLQTLVGGGRNSASQRVLRKAA